MRKLTVDEILDLMEAGGQHCLLVSPGGALARKLGQEGGFRLFRLLLRLLK